MNDKQVSTDAQSRIAELEAQLAAMTERYEANTAIMYARTEAMNRAHEQLTESREREGRMRQALQNLLRETHEPSCYHVHHAKRDQHEYIEACPVIQRHRTAVGRAVAALAADKEASRG